MEEFVRKIREEVKYTKNYDKQLAEIDAKLKSDNLLKVPLSELRENLFDLLLKVLNDKQFKQKTLLLSSVNTHVLRDCQHWRQESVKSKDQLVNQLLALIEETMFSQTEDAIKIDLLKMMLEASCINANAIAFDDLVRIINLSCKLITETHGRSFSRNQLNQSSECSLVLATYASSSQIMENFILYFENEEATKLQNVSIRNGYLCKETNCESFEDLRASKLKSVKGEKLGDKFLSLVGFLIDRYEQAEENNKIELKHFYLSSILVCLKCCTEQENVLLKLDMKLKDFLTNRFANFIFKLLDCRLQKSVYFKLELKKSDADKADSGGKNGAKTEGKTDRKCFLDEKLIKLIYLICEELFKVFAEFRPLRPTLVSITFKMCSSDDNQFFILKCINRIFKNHLLLFKLFYLTCRNEILIDTSILRLLLDSNKKTYQLISSANSAISALASQSIANINTLTESCNKIILEFTYPDNIINYRKLESDEPQRANSYDDLNLNFENYKNKLDDLLTSDEESLNGDLDRPNGSAISRNAEQTAGKADNPNEHNHRQNESFDDSSSHSDEHSNSDLNKKAIQSQNVLKFIYFLKNNLPNLMKCKSIIKIDDLIQRLSSEFCEQIKLENSLIINADGIYAAIFCSLSLNYQLFYPHSQSACDKCDKCDIHCDRRRCDRSTDQLKSEEQFIEEIHKSGLIVFLSTSWIKDIYQQLIEINLFDEVLGDQVDRRELINQPLIKLILDLDNQSICELIDYHKLNLNSADQLSKLDSSGHRNRSKNLAHKVKLMSELLDCAWPYLLNNLSYALRKDLKSFEKSASGDQDTKQSSLELICDTLRTAEQLIRIVYQLSQSEKCLEIFDLFLSTILTDLDESGPEKQASLNVLQVIAMRIILKHSMQLAADCPPIWKYFFSCSNYISNLEHKHFTEKLNKSQHQNLQKYRKILKNLPKNLTKKLTRSPKQDDKNNSLNLGDLLHNIHNLDNFDELNESVDAKFDTLNSSNNSINLIDDCDSLNEFSFDYTDFSLDKMDEFCDNPNENNPARSNHPKSVNQSTISEDNQQIDAIVERVLKESKLTVGQDDFEAFINHLCKQSTRVFEDSALRLNLRYLTIFLEQLISNSNRQLYSIANQDKSRTNLNHKSSIKTVKIFDYNCLLFDRFCDVIIKIFKSSRPIFHLMKSLQLASQHLIEAASFDYSEKVRKTSISTLNDLISNFLLNHVELQHFHFNETLFKSYETLLLLELCEMGIQEMIISSIAGFVEGFENEIGSAWRSVFRALCGVRLFTDDLNGASADQQQLAGSSLSWTEQIECVRQLRVIVDIFDSFLKIRNFEVFNQGAIDCLNCLFKMLKKSVGDSERNGLDLDELKLKNSFINLSLISLKCLHQFEDTLKEFHSNDQLICSHKPNFLLITFKTKLIDVNICELDFLRLINDDDDGENSDEESNEGMKKRENTPLGYLRVDLSEDQQKLNKILENWYVYHYYLHGLATSIELCSIDHQSKVIEILLSSLNFLLKNGHSEFGIYAINHIAFDVIQSWSNSINRKLVAQSHESDLVLNKIEFSSYKHLCIMITNLIVELLRQDQPSNGTNLLVFQFYVLFVQLLVGEYNFAISTLSVSCLKHVFKESTRFLNGQQCELVLHVLTVINRKSLAPFRKLLDFFVANKSESLDNAGDTQSKPQLRTNEIADLHVIGKLLSDQDNQLALEAELALQLLMQSYLNNQMELTDTGYLTKLYSFDIENENFTINKIVRKLLFIDFLLKEVGGLLLSSLKRDYRIKQFSSFDFDTLERVPFEKRENLIELVDDIHLTFERIDKSMKIKFLIQKISMFKPLINFYQINSVCFLLKFLCHFDQLCEEVRKERAPEFAGKASLQENGSEQQLQNEELIANLGEMLGRMIKDYIDFKVERKLNKAEEPNYSEFIRKVVADSKGQTQENDLKAKLDKFDGLLKTDRSDDRVGADKKNTRKNCVDLCIYDQSRNLDFDTESYLIIQNKIIAELLRLQIDLDAALFSRLFPCFLTFDYHLLAYKNDDFTQQLHELLIKFDRCE